MASRLQTTALENTSIAFVSLAILGQSLLLFPWSSLPISISWLFIIYCLFYFREVKLDGLILFGGANVFVLLTAAVNIGRIDIEEFFRSYASFFSFSLVLLMAISTNGLDKIAFRKGVMISTLIVSALTSLQVFSYMFGRETYAWFLFDTVSISTAENIDRFEAVNYLGYMRPVSIFHEPSYLALICLICFHLSHQCNSSKTVKSLLTANILLSFSAIIFPFFCLYLYLIGARKMRLILAIGALICLFAFGMSSLFGFFRLDEVLLEGTSGHERLIVPLLTVARYWAEYPLGVPVGNVFPQLNNSVAVFACYFGIFSLPIALIAITKVRKKEIPIYLVLLMTNGAFFTTEIAILIYMIIRTGSLSSD